MKPILCVGFIFRDLACRLSGRFGSGDESDGGSAAWDRIGDRRGGVGGIARDCAVANGTGESGRAGADAARLPGRPIVFCGGADPGGACERGGAANVGRIHERLRGTADRLSASEHCLPRTGDRRSRLDIERNNVRRFLEQAGLRVVPRGWYSLDAATFRRSAAADIATADLFVQLLSGVTGKRPPDLTEGYAKCQLQLALDASKPVLQWRGFS